MFIDGRFRRDKVRHSNEFRAQQVEFLDSLASLVQAHRVGGLALPSSKRLSSKTDASAATGVTVTFENLTGTASFARRTAARPISTTWCLCAGGTTARCTNRGGAFTSLMESPWWSRLPDQSNHSSGQSILDAHAPDGATAAALRFSRL